MIDSRETKDQYGNLTGREFLVLWKDYGGDEGTWEPFQNLLHCRKTLKAYYNKHPELPQPNFLAENQDEDFSPQRQKKNSLGRSKDQPTAAFRKPRGRPKNRVSLENPQKPKTQTSPIEEKLKTPVHLDSKLNSTITVEGLFKDEKTDNIIFHVCSNGKHFYQSRKWVLQNCKLGLIDFYEKCMVIKQ